jgi:hypothetical protein
VVSAALQSIIEQDSADVPQNAEECNENDC